MSLFQPITNRQATGSVQIGTDDPFTPDTGEIQHIVSTVKTSK